MEVNHMKKKKKRISIDEACDAYFDFIYDLGDSELTLDEFRNILKKTEYTFKSAFLAGALYGTDPDSWVSDIVDSANRVIDKSNKKEKSLTREDSVSKVKVPEVPKMELVREDYNVFELLTGKNKQWRWPWSKNKEKNNG